MFEQVIEKVPELAKLEQAIAGLEAEQGKAQARVSGLAAKVAEAEEADITREATALNAGRTPPKAKAPALLRQLEGAQRELQVLEKRLALAQADRAAYIADHRDHLAALLDQARAAAGAKVAEGASKVLADLLILFKIEDAARDLVRLHPAPAAENTGEPERHVTVFGPVHQRNITGGPQRGDIEGTLRYLESLGAATVVGEAEGEAVVVGGGDR